MYVKFSSSQKPYTDLSAAQLEWFLIKSQFRNLEYTSYTMALSGILWNVSHELRANCIFQHTHDPLCEVLINEVCTIQAQYLCHEIPFQFPIPFLAHKFKTQLMKLKMQQLLSHFLICYIFYSVACNTHILSRRLNTSLYSIPSIQYFFRSSRLHLNRVLQA